MAEQAGNVFKKKKRRVFGFKDTRDVKKERASRILETTAFSGNRETLAGESGTEQVKVGHFFCVDCGCVFIVDLLWVYMVYVSIGFISMFVNLRVANAGKTPGPLQTGTESADTGKHVKKPDVSCVHRYSSFLRIVKNIYNGC